MTRILLALMASLSVVAYAQSAFEAFVDEPMAYRIDVPTDWVAQPSPDRLYLIAQPPEGDPSFGQAAIELAIEPAYTGTLDQGVEEVLAGLRSGMPDLQVLSRSTATITGVPATIVLLRGTLSGNDVTYRVIFALHEGRGYVLFLEALSERFAAFAPTFDRVLGSFALTGAASAPVIEATFTHSGTVGHLPIDGRAAGRLAGVADAFAYHTYVIDVPYGLASLRVELDADIDLDLAIKHGSEIQSYAPRAQGGDWDILDVGNVNPTVVAIDQPHAGTWYVDVIHALAAGGVGSYRLRVHANSAQPPLDAQRAGGPAPTVPDACALLSLVPAAAAAGPPPSVSTGTRLTYYTASASIPGERTELVQDEHGNWVDQRSGQRYAEQDVPGPAGASLVVAQVGYVDRQVAQLTERSYTVDGTSGQAVFSTQRGSVAHAGCMPDYWVHPQALAGLPDSQRDDLRVLRMPYQLDERTFQAIRIHTTTAAGFSAYVYDLESGLLLYFGSRTVGPGGLAPAPGGATPGRGSTQLVNGWLLGVDNVDLPWQDAAVPTWVAQVGQLDYQGSFTAMMPGSPQFPLPVHHRIHVDHRGGAWLRSRTEVALYSFEGVLAGHEQFQMSYGPGIVGGLWIAPEALRSLTQGQLLERNEFVGCSTSVSTVSGDRVTVSEVGPLHRVDYVYDTRTGVLTGTTEVQQVGGTQYVQELQLVEPPR